MKKDFTFKGFDPANTTPVPDVFFDVLLPHMNEAQLKVMLYIIRRTLGFKKTEDAISLKQFRYGILTKDKKQLDNGCGLKNFTTISRALKELQQMNCIEKVPSKADAGDDATTVYRIHFRGTARNVVPPTRNVVGDYAKRSRGTAPNVVGVLRETYPQETVLQETDSQETVRQEGTYGANAPTPAHLLKEVDEELEKVEELQRITGEHKAVKPVNETPYHIVNAAIGKPEEDTDKHPAVQIKQAVAAGQASPVASLPFDAPVRQSTAPLHTPGLNHQAHPSLLDSEPAQAAIPPAAGNVVLPQHAPTAQASGFVPPKRPRAKKPPVLPPPPPTITLMPQEAAFWALWCGIWFNKDIPPRLSPTAYEHVRTLAPFITTEDDLKSLIIYARYDLQASSGVKRKAVQLGNLVNCYRGWKQEQAGREPPPKKEGTDFDIYKGNGPEEREAVYQEALRRQAEGTLIE